MLVSFSVIDCVCVSPYHAFVVYIMKQFRFGKIVMLVPDIFNSSNLPVSVPNVWCLKLLLALCSVSVFYFNFC